MTSIPDVQSLLFGGGPFMYLVAALALVGVFVAVVLALLTSLGRWTPAATWLAMPSAVLATGALGTWVGARVATNALAMASPTEVDMMASHGFSIAHYTEGLGLLLAGALLSVTALAGGIATLIASGSHDDARWTPASGGLALLLCLSLGAGLTLWAFLMQDHPTPLLVGVAVISGGLGCGLAALRIHGGDDGERRAAATRALLGFCAVGGVACAVALGKMVGDVAVHRAFAIGALELQQSLAWSGRSAGEAAGMLGLVAIPGMLVIALIPALPLARHLVVTRTQVSGIVAALILLPAAGCHLGASAQLESLFPWTRLASMEAMQGHLDGLPHAGLPDGVEPTFLEQRSSLVQLELSDDGRRWQPVYAPGLQGAPKLPLAAGPGPRLLLSAETPATSLADALVDRDGLVDLLIRLDPDAPAEVEGWPTGLATLAVELVPAGQEPRDLDLMRESFRPAVHRHVVAELPGVDTLAELRAAEAGDWYQLVLVPGASWTVQDVVTHCLVGRSVAGHEGYSDGGRWVRCTLAREAPAAPQERAPVPAPTELGDGPARAGDAVLRDHVDPQPPKARLSQGEPVVEGSEARQAIARTMRRYGGRFKQCYERALTRQPGLAGRASLSFTVEPDGKVTEAEVVSSTLDDDEVEACLARSMQRVRFPEDLSDTPVEVVYPLVLSTE